MHLDSAGGRDEAVGPAMWGCDCEHRPDHPPARADLPLVTRLAQSVSAGAMGRPHPPAHGLGPQSLAPSVVAAKAWGAPSVGGVAMGFPCQDISVVGQHLGLDGSRSSLVFEALRLRRAAPSPLHPPAHPGCRRSLSTNTGTRRAHDADLYADLHVDLHADLCVGLQADLHADLSSDAHADLNVD